MKIKINFTVKMLVAMVLGIIAGLVFGPKVASVKFIGDIFLRLVQMCVVPLIMGQIISAVGTPDPREIGKVGLKAVSIFGVSSLLAALFGIFMAVVFKPGRGMDLSSTVNLTVNINQNSSFIDTLVNFFPSNIIDAMAKGTIIQVIAFSLFFGIALSLYPHKEKKVVFLESLNTFNDVIMKLITIVMNLAPLGIGILLASTVGQIGKEVIRPLVNYLLVFGLGTLIFMVIWVVFTASYCKVSIIKLINKLIPMSLIAIGTTSSAVTLPTEMKDSREKIGISDRIANLILPLGMPLNSNGAAMHMAITVITTAQIYGVTYGFGDYFYIAIMATLLSLANAVAPGADIVSLAMIIPQMGLPIESIAIFAGVGYFVGALRTILNVDSDVFTAMLVAKSENELDHDVFNGVSASVAEESRLEAGNN